MEWSRYLTFGTPQSSQDKKQQSPSSHAISSFLATPASCDTAVNFDLPENAPVNDAEFFESMLQKLTDEIISDLPTVYEMNTEAVEW